MSESIWNKCSTGCSPAELPPPAERALGHVPNMTRAMKLIALVAWRAAEAQHEGEGGKAGGKAGGYLAAADIVSEESATSTVSTYDCPVCRKPHILDLDRLQVWHSNTFCGDAGSSMVTQQQHVGERCAGSVVRLREAAPRVQLPQLPRRGC